MSMLFTHFHLSLAIDEGWREWKSIVLTLPLESERARENYSKFSKCVMAPHVPTLPLESERAHGNYGKFSKLVILYSDHYFS